MAVAEEDEEEDCRKGEGAEDHAAMEKALITR